MVFPTPKNEPTSIVKLGSKKLATAAGKHSRRGLGHQLSLTWSLIYVSDVVHETWVLPYALLVGLEVDVIYLKHSKLRSSKHQTRIWSSQLDDAQTSSKRMSVIKRRMSASVSWLPAM